MLFDGTYERHDVMGADPILDFDLDLLGTFHGSVPTTTDSHDRGARSASDPDWLEINGNPTIPPVQSIRAPPAQIALHATKDNMIGITNKNVSRKYLEKLQRDRERNQEVLAECIDKLPITIKQLVYPEKPTTKDFRFGSVSSGQSRETKFRMGRSNDYWHETADQWVHEDSNTADPDFMSNHYNNNKHKRNGKRDNSHHSRSTSDSAFVDKDFVHYPGFQGAAGQSQSLKYRYGKKKSAGINSAESPTKQAPVKFKPKGYGSLYDELEFERRYKKVFDLNKHIHFVHSNYLSGQRLMKKSRLPPLGYNPSVQSDPMDPGDIFAIMSVQKFNHPGEVDKGRAVVSNPGSGVRKSEGPYDRRENKPKLEVTQSLDTPVGFVPGTIIKTGSSPFDGVNGANNEITPPSLYRLQSISRDDRDTARTLSSVEEHRADSHRTVNNKRKPDDDRRRTNTHKRVQQTQNSVRSEVGSEMTDDPEPFNIRVHVEIRAPKDRDASDNGGSSDDNEQVDDAHNDNNIDEDENLHENADEFDKETKDDGTFEEKIVYPTKLETFEEEVTEDTDINTRVAGTIIKPRNIAILTNEFGFVTKKVQYPQKFVIGNHKTSSETNLDNT